MIVPWVTHGRKPASNGQYTRERDVEGQGASQLGGSVNRASALKGVYLSRSESPEARGWHGQVTFNFLCPSSKPEPKHRHINSESTVQTALKAKQVYWLELPDSRGAEVATEARSRRKGRGRRDPFWMLAERKLKRATAEPFFRYSKFKLFK